jgi:uncharacterized OB-fold protein
MGEAMPRPLDPSLFADGEPLRLAGSRCLRCATVQFPVAAQCAHCAASDSTPVALPHEGAVWTWTIQRFAPKPPYQPPPEGFNAFAVGYVDLGQVMVESVLDVDTETLSIGMPVHLVTIPVSGDSDCYTYGFAA